MRDHLDPELGDIGPMLDTGKYARCQLIHQDMVHLLYGTRLTPLPLQQSPPPPHVPQVGDYYKVAHPSPVLK